MPHRSGTALLAATLLLLGFAAPGQDKDFTAIRAEVDFGKHLQEWDGFGVNYVETAQAIDYTRNPQDYGGFGIMSEEKRQEIIDLVFGEDGLKPGLVKMFLDPFHQAEPGGQFDHETSTEWMRYWVREGLATTRARGADLSIITTLYGPPPWATLQKFLRGRDLDPARKVDLANYMIHWVKWLREEEGLPVDYLSLHNQGEDWARWPPDGKDGNIGYGHDYNLYWPPEQVVDFMTFMRPLMDEAGLKDVGLAPGGTSNWHRFNAWGYGDALAESTDALKNLGLITSHGFYDGTYGQWYGGHAATGADRIRDQRPELQTWVTATGWGKLDAKFIMEMHGNIYTAKANGIIPWACIQRPGVWVGGDPNPGHAFTVSDDGEYKVTRGYHYYKQVSRAGQPGMTVASTMAMDSEVALIGFAGNGTGNPDALVVVNIANYDQEISISVSGTSSTQFDAFRTTDDEERYTPAGTFTIENGTILLKAPEQSVTTLFGK